MERDPAYDHTAHTVIAFQELLDRNVNVNALRVVLQEFRTKGWCIVRFPRFLNEKWANYSYNYHPEVPFMQSDVERNLNSFFSLPEAVKKTCVGYSSFPHKEGVHLITPYYLDGTYKQVPLAKEVLEKWSTMWNVISVDLLEVFAKPIFGCDNPTLAHRADLPIAFGKNKGMLDVAYYRNNQTATLSPSLGDSTQDVNCVPHYDPGLFSISFFSNMEGLQLQNPSTGQWLAGPVNTRPGQEDLGVIWLGAAAVRATKGELHEAVHRVVYPQTPHPRITAWYEACTVEQINNDVEKFFPEKLTNIVKYKQLTLARGDPNIITRYYGLPMSKVHSRDDGFAAFYSSDRQQKEQVWDTTNDVIMGDV